MTPGLDDSTAPIADECQSFLDNVVAQFGRRRALNDRPGAVRANEVLEVVRSACGDDGQPKRNPLNCFSPSKQRVSKDRRVVTARREKHEAMPDRVLKRRSARETKIRSIEYSSRLPRDQIS